MKTDDATISAPLLVTLALLGALAPVASDLYLAVLPPPGMELKPTPTDSRISLTAFVFGAGVGHVVFGVLADRVGRRLPLILGTVLFVLASLSAAAATTTYPFVLARFVQGLAAVAGMVIGRAIVADLVNDAQAARAFSAMTLTGYAGLVAAPCIAGLVDLIGWRGFQLILAGLGALLIPAVLTFVPETKRKEAAAPKSDLEWNQQGSVLAVFNTPRFVAYALSAGLLLVALLASITAFAAILEDLVRLTPMQSGLVSVASALVLIVAAVSSHALAARFAIGMQERLAVPLYLAATTLLIILAVTGLAPAGIAMLVPVAMASIGLIAGTTTAHALGAIAGPTGAASAVVGLLQFMFAGLLVTVAGVVGRGFPAMAAVMLAAALLARLAFSFGARAYR